MAAICEKDRKAAGGYTEREAEDHKAKRTKPEKNAETRRKKPDQDAESQSKTPPQSRKSAQKERGKETGLVTDRQLLPRMPYCVSDRSAAGEKEEYGEII